MLNKKRTIISSILLIPTLVVVYLLVAYISSKITLNDNQNKNNSNVVFLNTNGVHLDIIIPINKVSSELKNGLEIRENTNYISFGWGDKNFYLNTPTWNDLTFSTAVNAMFLKSETLMHVSYYRTQKSKWVKILLNDEQLNKLNKNINKAFYISLDSATKQIIPKAGYGLNDDFFKANGSYSCFKTCNTWVNSTLKESEIKSCLWTPFDSELINKHKKR